MRKLNYLLPPTGLYQVGYQENFELGVRIYYPSLESSQPGDLYYPPVIERLKSDIKACPEVSEAEAQSLELIRIYAKENLTIIPGQVFPVIIFSPGTDSSAQIYTNLICCLASHGYIIIARDNTNRLQGPKTALNEVLAIRQKIYLLHAEYPVFAAMDLQRVGLLGHSLGASVSLMAAHKNPYWFKFNAVVALDAAYISNRWNVRQGCEIPCLQIHTSTWRYNYAGEEKSYNGNGALQLKRQNYHVLLAPKESDKYYSDHNDFTDSVTLKYHPAFSAFLKLLISLESQKPNLIVPKGMDVASPLQLGRSQDSHKMAHTVNQYVVSFFDMFLRNIPTLIFTKGLPLSGTLMRSALPKECKVFSGHSMVTSFKKNNDDSKQSITSRSQNYDIEFPKLPSMKSSR